MISNRIAHTGPGLLATIPPYNVQHSLESQTIFDKKTSTKVPPSDDDVVLETSTHDNDIIVLDDDDDDVITSSDSSNLNNKTKPKTINNVDLLTDAIGINNYNMIISALCTLSNIETKSKGFTALFSGSKEVQSRKVQTDPVELHTLSVPEEPMVMDDTRTMNISHNSDSPEINNCEQDIFVQPFHEEYASEVVIEMEECSENSLEPDQQVLADTVVTGEGELKLNNRSSSSGGINFILKGDGRNSPRSE